MSIINVFRAIARDFFVFFWPVSKKARFIRLGVVVLVIVGGLFFLLKGSKIEDEPYSAPAPVVKTTSVNKLQNTSSSAFIGSVRAVSESDMQFEIGGRVTSVPVVVGQTVRAGTIIATVENSSQRAALVQARGSYDAALASAALSEVSVADAERGIVTAKQSAISSLQSAYSTTNLQVRSVLDQFYGNPDYSTPGLRIKTNVPSQNLNDARVALQKTLPLWESEVNSLNTNTNLANALVSGIKNIDSVLALTDSFASSIDQADSNDTLNGRSVLSYAGEVAAMRSTLIGLKSNLQSAENSLKNSEDVLAKARISSTQNSQNSVAQAQVTQAQGSLMAAQAQFEKTIVRAPITGTVDVLRIRVGDYVSPNTPVALVTGGSGFEISLFVGERDAELFVIGATAMVDGDKNATVASISNTIDPKTLKREVVLSLDDGSGYVSGDTVNLQFEATERTVGKIEVPISALKFVNDDAFMFKVEDEKLVTFPVVVGEVFGGKVEIVSGLEIDTEFVIDVRGKSAGQSVKTSN